MSSEIDAQAEFAERRAALVKAEIFRYRVATYSLLIISVLTFFFLVISMYKRGFSSPDWQSIVLLFFVTGCIALPLFSKFSLSKDGGSFDVANPVEFFDRLEAKAQAARSETFEQTRTQISALSDQISELSAPRKAATDQSSEVDIGTGKPSTTSELSLRDVRWLLPPPTVKDDPQKGRFGGSSSSSNRNLTARISKSDIGRKWYTINFLLSSSDSSPITGAYAFFFMHDTFSPDVYKVKVPRGALSVGFETAATGAFTAGVVADKGQTKLEIDLAAPEIAAPITFKNR